MKLLTSLTHLTPPGLALALGVTFVASIAQAAPYACDLTNNAGVLSFRLNENADNVTVISDGGGVTNNLGPGLKGLTVTNLGLAGGVFQVIVSRTATVGYTQISSDGFQENGVYVNKFEQPRGIVINKNPTTPSFGRIFVANGRGEAPTSGTYVRTTYQGIYALNSDDTVALDTGTFPRTAGLPFTAGNTASPMRLTIGKGDDLLYISDFSDPNGGVSVCDLDVATNSVATNVLAGIGDLSYGSTTHGSAYGVVVEGSLATSSLKVWTIDEDLSPVRSVWRYDVNGGPFPYEGSPVGPLHTMSIGNYSCKLVKGGGNNYLYCSQNRSSGTETDGSGVRVFTDDGVQITDSQVASREYLNDPAAADLFRNTLALDLSPDGNTLALLRGGSFGRVWLVPLTNGVFNFAGTNSFSYGLPASDSTRDIAYDAAGNLYVVSSAYSAGNGEWLRIFSRGGTTIATSGSDGTFSLEIPPAVAVTADVNVLSESNPKTATITFTRQADAIANALAFSVTTGGTAVRGTDYVLQTNAVTLTDNTLTMPAGQQAVTMTVVVQDDSVAELTETIIIGLGSSPSYSAGAPASQTVTITDNEPATADLAVVTGTTYERLTGDYARLRVVRRGDTNAPGFTVNLAYSGSATPDTDYFTTPSVYIEQGVVNQNFDLTPQNDALLEGDETITCTVAAGSDYAIGTNSPSVDATILDDELPPETVLWSANFDTDDSANWTLQFGSGNGIPDYRYVFNYDYTSASWINYIPASPHATSETMGLYLAVNKDDSTAAGAAGIDVYPNGKSFTGNYAVRFDMYLMVGTAATTEHALFGINHSGSKTNWFRSGGVPAGWTFDGLFYGVETDAAAYGDYVIYSAPTTVGNNPTALTPGRNASTLTGVFKSPPFTYAGAPANGDASATGNWVDVEISQVGNLVTLTMNRTPIMSYTNTTAFTSGNIMLGHCDSFDSVGSTTTGVVYDNLRVIQLPASSRPNITQIQVIGGSVEISFTGEAADAASSFGLQAANTVNGTYSDESASITGSAGSFKAVLAPVGAQQFYRIKRNN